LAQECVSPVECANLFVRRSRQGFLSLRKNWPMNTMPDDKPRFQLPWLRYLVIFGQKPPALTRRQWTVIFLLSSCGFFKSYDGMIFGMALPQIQRDLGLLDHQLSLMGSFIASGPLLGFPLLLRADQRGRREVLLLTLVPFSILTGLTALCTSVYMFAFCQWSARIFMSGESIVSNVVIVEEMPKECRGWAIGVTFACACFGSGFAMLFFGLFGSKPGSWRALYAAAVVPVIFIAYLRQFLPETERFQQAAVVNQHCEISGSSSASPPVGGGMISAWRINSMFMRALDPVRQLFAHHGRQTVSVLAVSFWDSFTSGAHSLYDYKYLQDVHGFEPHHVSLLGIVGGLLALGMFTLAGEASDRMGRRRLLSGGYVVHSFLTALYYMVPESFDVANSIALCVLWTLRVAIGMGMGTLSTALFAEIFPTASRATAQCIGLVGDCCGKPVGIFIHGILVPSVIRNSWHAIALLMSLQVLCGCVILRYFPETAGRELEDIVDSTSAAVIGKVDYELSDLVDTAQGDS